VEALPISLMLIVITAAFFPSLSCFMAAGSAHAAEFQVAGNNKEPEVVDNTGSKVSFRSFIGRKPLVVVFWATWCPLCRDEVPALNRLANEPNFQILAVNLGEDEQKVRTFISSFRVNYPVVRDPGWQTTGAFQVLGIPYCIILDEGGQVLYRGSVVPGNIEAYLRR
jgi:thiol-disulfide isomerase/thioredoxin